MIHEGAGTPGLRQSKAKKRGGRLVTAYALRVAVVLLLALMLVIMM